MDSDVLLRTKVWGQQFIKVQMDNYGIPSTLHRNENFAFSTVGH